MDEIMQTVFEVKEKLSDSEYKKLVDLISATNPNKDIVVEYPPDLKGVNPVVTASPQEHINNLKKKYKNLIEKYNKDTTRYLTMIADLSEENIKLRRDAEDWEDDDESEDEEGAWRLIKNIFLEYSINNNGGWSHAARSLWRTGCLPYW